MGQVFLYQLRPRAAFHFGERGVGIEETDTMFHSDSLFSALCSVLREMEGREFLEVLVLDPFVQGQPPFRLTSAYPFAGHVLLFPKPTRSPGPAAGPDAEKTTDREKERLYRGVRLVSQGIFTAMVRGEDLDAHLDERNLFQDKAVWVLPAEHEAGRLRGAHMGAVLWGRDQVPRVTVDRLTSASAIYHAGLLRFNEDCGLYFLVDYEDLDFRSYLEAALLLLSDAGIGGERSSGYGQFTPILPGTPVTLPNHPDANALLTLSLYAPQLAELQAGVLGPGAAYDIVDRFGWMSSPEARSYRRKNVRMLAEGAVLMAPPDEVLGRLADVTPGIFTADPEHHRVYRYGYAFPIGVRVEVPEDDE